MKIRGGNFGTTVLSASLALTLGLTGLVLALAPSASAQEAGGKSTELSKVERLNRAPVNKEVLRVKLPHASEHKLANGLTVLVLERHELPTVAFELELKPGAIADPTPGMASFTADMLTEGTSRKNSAQIAAAIEDIGATVEAEAEYGGSDTTVSASGLIDNTDEILGLMSDVTLNPSFPAEELEKYKKRQLGELEDERSRPDFLASEAFQRDLYGNTNYAVTAATPEAINAVTSQALAEYHAKYYVPANATLGIVGDVNTEELLKVVEKYFGPWKGGPAASGQLAQVPAPQAKRITLVDRPGSVQTNILAGNLTVKRADPDYFVLTVMQRVLGGGPSARLFLNLREAHGYTYGAYSRLRTDVYRGSWYANTEVRTPVTDGSMHELLFEFGRLRTEPVPDAELEESKRSLVARFALSLESSETLLENALAVKHYGLPEDYWDTYPEKIAAVNPAGLQKAAEKYIDLDHLQIVAVGDAKQIKDVLSKYGPVEVGMPGGGK